MVSALAEAAHDDTLASKLVQAREQEDIVAATRSVIEVSLRGAIDIINEDMAEPVASLMEPEAALDETLASELVHDTEHEVGTEEDIAAVTRSVIKLALRGAIDIINADTAKRSCISSQ